MTPDKTREARAYRFGPLERRGVAGGLRLGQVLWLAAAGAAAVAAARVLANASGLLIGAGLIGSAAIVSFAPIGGRTPEEWLPIVADWLRGSVNGSHRFRSRQPTGGVRASLD